jgi:hypothetical protein
MFEVFAISGLTLLIGLISLAHDSRGGKTTTIALGSSLFVLCCVEVTTQFQAEKEKAEAQMKQAEAEGRTDEYRDFSLSLMEKLDDRTEEVSSTVLNIKDILIGQLGYSEERANVADSETIGQSLISAQAVQDEILLVTPEEKLRRQAITLEYFAKGFDGDVVAKTLTQLGFNPDPDPSNLSNIPTNAVWVGETILPEDAQAIALSLLSAGVELKSVRTFDSESSNRGRHLIQVGSDRQLYEDDDCLPLTYEQIQGVQQIDRNTLVCGR